MEERKNNASVEKRLKDKLKTDRARIQVGRISGFGLLEMSRQRLRPGMLEATTQPCPHCHGTGLLRSDDSLGLTILRQLEEEGVRKRSREVLLKAPVGIVNFLMNQKRDHILQIETRYGMSVRIEADPHLISPDYTIEKFKTATRVVEVTTPVISADSSLMPDMDEDEDEDLTDLEVAEDEEEETTAAPSTNVSSTGEPSQQPRKKRRRRRRRKGGNGNGQYAAGGESTDGADAASDEDAGEDDASDAAEDEVTEVQAEAVEAEEAVAEAKPKPRSRTRTRKPKADAAPKVAAEAVAEAPVEAVAEVEAEAAPEEAPAEKPKRASRSRKPKASEDAPAAEPVVEEAAAEKPVAEKSVTKEPAAKKAVAAEVAADDAAADEADDPSKPKRRGWWSIGR
jgi:ribonuclease E